MTTRMKLTFDAPANMDVGELLEKIADQTMRGDEEGTIVDGEETIAWRMREVGEGVAIDRRQRLAAAALLMGFDLPQVMTQAAMSIQEAADICPGMTTGDMAPMDGQGRRNALRLARTLIDEMLGEIGSGMAATTD